MLKKENDILTKFNNIEWHEEQTMYDASLIGINGNLYAVGISSYTVKIRVYKYFKGLNDFYLWGTHIPLQKGLILDMLSRYEEELYE